MTCYPTGPINKFVLFDKKDACLSQPAVTLEIQEMTKAQCTGGFGQTLHTIQKGMLNNRKRDKISMILSRPEEKSKQQPKYQSKDQCTEMSLRKQWLRTCKCMIQTLQHHCELDCPYPVHKQEVIVKQAVAQNSQEGALCWHGCIMVSLTCR